MDSQKWLFWAQRLQALAQNGLAYSTNPFDIERFHQVQSVAAEILSDYGQSDLEIIENILTSEPGYATPKLDVRGVVFRDDKILLVKELADGGWTLPGGWVDVNEPPSLAVEREVFEESGFKVKANKLLAIYDRNLHGHPAYIFHIYKIYLRCELIGGEAADSIETAGANFFAEDHLPPLSIARTTPEVLARMFEHFKHPDWPADFD
jgi:ADP-ribose pyrophosphatase YjhB (NUDIX family)